MWVLPVITKETMNHTIIYYIFPSVSVDDATGDNVGTTSDNKRDNESHNNILSISISTCR